MSTIIGTLVAKLVMDAADYDKSTENAKSKAADLSKSLSSAGTKMTAGLTLPIVGAGVAAVLMASDVDESMSKVNTLFGAAGEQVIDWSSTTGEGFGIAKADALSFSGELGNLLIAQGLAGDEAAAMSMDFVELAADMASFNNASPEETFAAIQAGAIGSSEPLRKYGVVIMEASVANKAMEMTGKKNKDQLTEQDKTLARLKLIMEQTTASQGDFHRTSEGLANQTRIATATFKDQTAMLGTQLLPIGIKLIGWVNDAISWFSKLTDSNRTLILVVGGLVAGIGPLLLIIAQVITIFTTLMPVIGAVAGIITFPLIAVIAAVIAIIALLWLAWQNNWGDIQGKTEAVINFIEGLVTWWVGRVRSSFDTVVDIAQGMAQGFEDAFGWIGDQVEIAKGVVKSLETAFTNSMAGIRGAIQWVIDKIATFINWLNKIKIPKAISGFSPSPFETSLRGIGSAMDDLARKQIPQMNTALAGGNTYQYFLQGRYTFESEQSVVDKLKIMELLRK